ncbi:hypothetical protein K1719_014928 [Acacia pycnantha]|nr:hypothetical protein K1719_014928 [Acacia pycnantha]
MASINLHCSSVAFPTSSKIVHCDPLLNGKGSLRRLGLSFKVDDKVRAVISGEGHLLSRLESGNDPLALKEAIDPIQIRQQLDTIAFGTLSEQTGPMTRGFYSNINELDLDHPTNGFSSIPDAIEDVRPGKSIIV